MKAYKLYNTTTGASAFTTVEVPELDQYKASHFFFKQTAPHAVYDWHPAPQVQYVITLKGSLEFTVTNGDTFTIHPGDVLIAADIYGVGHKWRTIGNDGWERMYVVLDATEIAAIME